MRDDDRPKAIPEFRGMPPEAQGRPPDRPYSAASYSAQYGVTLNEAEHLIARYASSDGKTGHLQIKAEVESLLTLDPDRLHKAMRGREVHEPGPVAGLRSGEPVPADVDGFATPGRVMADAGMLQVGEPKPRKDLAHRFTLRALDALMETVVDGDGLQEWLDRCMARGDHALSTTTFVWDDIPDSVREGLRRMLAMRYVESKLDAGDKKMIALVEAIREDQEGG